MVIRTKLKEGTKNDPYLKRARYFLSERLKQEYCAIALDFNKGRLNAINSKTKNS
jgi:hypothetical protein